MLRCVVAALFAALFLSGCGQLVTPRLKTEVTDLKSGEYKVDAKHTSLLFKVNHLGFAKYVGRFNEFDAELDFDSKNMSAARLNARVAMGSVDLNNEKLEDTLKARAWFDVANHPFASFQTTGARLVADNAAVFTGNMVFLGRSVPVDIHLTFNGGGINMLNASYTIGFEAHATFNRSDFGLDRFIPAIGDEIELEVHAEFKRQ